MVSTINQYQNLFGVRQGMNPGQLAQQLGTKKPEVAADLFTLSPTAQLMQQFLSMDVSEHSERGETDLTGLEQLKQRGDMLSNMLQLKLKNFESSLMSTMKSAGIDPSQSMELKQGDNGLLLANDGSGLESIQNLLKNNKSLQDQFQDISRLAGLLGTMQQMGTEPSANSWAGISSASQYAQQSQQQKAPLKQADAQFVLRVMEGNASYSFE